MFYLMKGKFHCASLWWLMHCHRLYKLSHRQLLLFNCKRSECFAVTKVTPYNAPHCHRLQFNQLNILNQLRSRNPIPTSNPSIKVSHITLCPSSELCTVSLLYPHMRSYFQNTHEQGHRQSSPIYNDTTVCASMRGMLCSVHRSEQSNVFILSKRQQSYIFISTVPMDTGLKSLIRLTSLKLNSRGYTSK